MHEIAVNVIVHYKASASITPPVVFLCLFIMVLILYVSFYTSSVKKGEGLLHACIF